MIILEGATPEGSTISKSSSCDRGGARYGERGVTEGGRYGVLRGSLNGGKKELVLRHQREPHPLDDFLQHLLHGDPLFLRVVLPPCLHGDEHVDFLPRGPT
jgi:hypothetical protein